MFYILVEVEIKRVVKIFKIEIYIIGVEIIIKNTFTWGVIHLADYCAVVADDFVIFFYVIKKGIEGLGVVGVDKVNHSGFVQEKLGFFVVKGLKGREVVGQAVGIAPVVQDDLGDVAKGAGVFRKAILQGEVGFGIPGFVDGLD